MLKGLFLNEYPAACCGWDKGHAYSTWAWISYLSPSLCGGASDAPPACSGVRRRRFTYSAAL